MIERLLDTWGRGVATVLQESAKVSSSIASHGGLVGEARESLLRDTLQRLLPGSLVVGTGQIVDSFDTLSRQVDVVIYRNEFPIFRTYGSSDVFLVEGVVAAIEVKSSLGGQNLDQALANCRSVKMLRINVDAESLERAVLGSELPRVRQSTTALLEEVLSKSDSSAGNDLARALTQLLAIDPGYSRSPSIVQEIRARGASAASKLDVSKRFHEVVPRRWGELPQSEKDLFLQQLQPACYVFGYRHYSSNVGALAKAIHAWGADPNRWGEPLRGTELDQWVADLKAPHMDGNLLARPGVLPDVIATEGCAVVRNLDFEAIGQTVIRNASDEWWALVGTADETPLRYLLAHLLRQILLSTGELTHSATGLNYDLGPYAQIDRKEPTDWLGFYQQVREA